MTRKALPTCDLDFSSFFRHCAASEAAWIVRRHYHFEHDTMSRCPSLDMQISRLVFLLFIPLGLWLAGCSPPTGPVTAQQMQSLTNAVQKLTSDSIMKVEQLDVGVLLVSTDSVPPGTRQSFCMQRMRRGWNLVPSSTTP